MFKAVITFEAMGANTHLTLRMICASREQLEHLKNSGALEGGQQTVERLERYYSPG